MPSRSLLIMASSEDSTIAASNESRSGVAMCMQGQGRDATQSNTLREASNPPQGGEAAGCRLAAEVGSVPLSVLRPLFGQVVQRKNGGDRTDRHAGAAVDAFHRIDIDHLFSREFFGVLFRVNAIHRAGVHACRVLHTNAGFSNYVRHNYSRLSAWGETGWLKLDYLHGAYGSDNKSFAS